MNSLAIENPITGDVMEILQSPQKTGHQTLRVRFHIAPRSAGAPPLHYHRVVTETFQVEVGVLYVQIGQKKRRLEAGERVTLAPGTRHRFWNPDSTNTVTFVAEVTPGADFEQFLARMYGLARSGDTDAKGMPRELYQWYFLLHDADLWFPAIPVRLQRLIHRVLRKIAQRKQEP